MPTNITNWRTNILQTVKNDHQYVHACLDNLADTLGTIGAFDTTPTLLNNAKRDKTIADLIQANQMSLDKYRFLYQPMKQKNWPNLQHKAMAQAIQFLFGRTDYLLIGDDLLAWLNHDTHQLKTKHRSLISYANTALLIEHHLWNDRRYLKED